RRSERHRRAVVADRAPPRGCVAAREAGAAAGEAGDRISQQRITRHRGLETRERTFARAEAACARVLGAVCGSDRACALALRRRMLVWRPHDETSVAHAPVFVARAVARNAAIISAGTRPHLLKEVTHESLGSN